MENYKKLYFMLFQKTSKAIDLLKICPQNAGYVAELLTETQLNCENLYINSKTGSKKSKKHQQEEYAAYC